MLCIMWFQGISPIVGDDPGISAKTDPRISPASLSIPRRCGVIRWHASRRLLGADVLEEDTAVLETFLDQAIAGVGPGRRRSVRPSDSRCCCGPTGSR